jgi:adenosylhomocysteine nucleosidase
MNRLIVIPTQGEIDPFLGALGDSGLEVSHRSIGRLATVDVPKLDVTVAVGGFGKTQFGVHTQHLIDAGGPWSMVVCAGAAGALSEEIGIGDIVVGTETIEHDMRSSSGRPPPRHPGSDQIVEDLRRVDIAAAGFDMRIAEIASGDEDVIDRQRRSEIHAATGALAVAWEGAGGARAAAFSEVPFVEIRGITDMADETLGSSFRENLPVAMGNIAMFVARWFGG